MNNYTLMSANRKVTTKTVSNRWRWLPFILLGILSSPLYGQSILYDVYYETGDFSEVNADRYSGVHKGGKNASVTVVNNPLKGPGNPTDKVARFSITPSDERAELRHWRASGMDELWYGWQMLLPANWQPVEGKDENIQQWHRKGGIQGTYVARHPMVLRIEDNGEYGITYNYSTGNNTRYEGNEKLNKVNAYQDRGKWVNWAMHVKWAQYESDNGFIRIYHNGKLVWEHLGRNWEFVKDSGYPFYMGGIYTGDPGWRGLSEYVMYQDNHIVGDANATINDVNPYLNNTPSPEPEPEPDPRPCADNNLALSSSIHSVSSEQSGNPATNLIDGVSDTDANRWSAQGYPQWVILDLGSTQSIGATRLRGYQDRAYQYQVYASSSLSAVESSDPSALVADGSSNSADGSVEQRFAPTQARYVKLEVVGASNYDGDWVSAREVAVLSSCEEEEPSDPGSGSISIRAQGDCGSEVMELRVDGAKVDEWTVSTAMSDYEYAGFTGGQVSVHLVNDQLEPCDRNLTVDYLTVCGSTYQTEQVATETATCCTNVADKLFTNGNFDFGTLSCEGSAAQTTAPASAKASRPSVQVYPNPASEQVVVVGPQDYEVTLYTVEGELLRHYPDLSGRSSLNVASLRPGVYLLRTTDTQTQQTHHQRIIIE